MRPEAEPKEDDSGTVRVMPDVPSQKEREWLLDRLAELIHQCGYERFVSAPILDGSAPYFPDPWQPDPAGLQVLARRLLWHSGLRTVRARVRDLRGHERPGFEQLTSTQVWLAEVHHDREVVELEVASLGNDDILGILCHEIAAAFRAYHKLDDPGAAPFRDLGIPEEQSESDVYRRAMLASVAAIYLGFGVLATNASHSARHSGDVIGSTHTTEWALTAAGGLPAQAMSFLLAVQLVIRGEKAPSLLPNQEAELRAWSQTLAETRDALIERLHLPPEDTWPAREALAVEAFDDEEYDAEGALSDEERKRFNAGRRVFRVKRFRTSWHAPIGILGGAAVAVFLVPAFGLAAGLVPALAMGAAGIAMRKTTRDDHCADPLCSASITEADEVCPRCGGTIAGEINHPDERLAAEEALEAQSAAGAADEDEGAADEGANQADASEDQDDADEEDAADEKRLR